MHSGLDLHSLHCPDTAAIDECIALAVTEEADTPRHATRAHPGLTVTIHATEGVVYVVSGDDDHLLTPGDHAVVPAGTRYRRFNAGDERASWIEVYRAV